MKLSGKHVRQKSLLAQAVSDYRALALRFSLSMTTEASWQNSWSTGDPKLVNQRGAEEKTEGEGLHLHSWGADGFFPDLWRCVADTSMGLSVLHPQTISKIICPWSLWLSHAMSSPSLPFLSRPGTNGIATLPLAEDTRMSCYGASPPFPCQRLTRFQNQ